MRGRGCAGVHGHTQGHVSACTHVGTSALLFVSRRFLYKVRGPKACHFQVTPELAAELDAMTLEQIQEQAKKR